MPESEMTAATAGTRLPCRGCTRDCGFFNVCEGKLWAMGRETLSPEAMAEQARAEQARAEQARAEEQQTADKARLADNTEPREVL